MHGGAIWPHLRCSCCGRPMPALRWVRGGYWRGGYYACDECVRRRDADFWAALLLVAAVAVAPLVATLIWIASTFARILFHA